MVVASEGRWLAESVGAKGELACLASFAPA